MDVQTNTGKMLMIAPILYVLLVMTTVSGATQQPSSAQNAIILMTEPTTCILSQTSVLPPVPILTGKMALIVLILVVLLVTTIACGVTQVAQIAPYAIRSNTPRYICI